MDNRKLYAVIGNPVLHSKSPFIFNKAFEKMNINARYLRVAAESAQEVVLLLKTLGFSGLSVTAPFKSEIIDYLDNIASLAEGMGSVNTVVMGDGKLYGFNTDYIGVVDSFYKNNIELKGKNIAVLGAGGAARAVVYGLMKENASITIFNRNVERAQKLASRTSNKYDDLVNLRRRISEMDIIISTLPAGVNVLQVEDLESRQVIFDANYTNSVLEKIGKQAGCYFIKGEEWLINQAIPAFKHFTGIELEADSIINPVRYSFGKQKKRNIALIGFMGTGKSKIGLELAKLTGRRYADIDELIADRCGKSISEIFAQDGEQYFREIEMEILRSLIMEKNQIISCGGGIILDEKNRALLRENSLCIWLHSSIPTIIQRIKEESRPLLDCCDPLETAGRIFENRKELYAETADLLIYNENKSIENIVGRLYEEISNLF